MVCWTFCWDCGIFGELSCPVGAGAPNHPERAAAATAGTCHPNLPAGRILPAAAAACYPTRRIVARSANPEDYAQPEPCQTKATAQHPQPTPLTPYGCPPLSLIRLGFELASNNDTHTLLECFGHVLRHFAPWELPSPHCQEARVQKVVRHPVHKLTGLRVKN